MKHELRAFKGTSLLEFDAWVTRIREDLIAKLRKKKEHQGLLVEVSYKEIVYGE